MDWLARKRGLEAKRDDLLARLNAVLGQLDLVNEVLAEASRAPAEPAAPEPPMVPRVA